MSNAECEKQLKKETGKEKSLPDRIYEVGFMAGLYWAKQSIDEGITIAVEDFSKKAKRKKKARSK